MILLSRFDGIAVASPSELQEQVGKHRPGDKANITYIRNGKEINCTDNNEERCRKYKCCNSRNGWWRRIVYGARLESLGSSDKQKFNLDYGVKVTEINDGKLKDLGLKKGYIILSVNGKKVKTAPEVRQATDNESELKSIEGIQSNGTIFSYSFRN